MPLCCHAGVQPLVAGGPTAVLPPLPLRDALSCCRPCQRTRPLPSNTLSKHCTLSAPVQALCWPSSACPTSWADCLSRTSSKSCPCCSSASATATRCAQLVGGGAAVGGGEAAGCCATQQSKRRRQAGEGWKAVCCRGACHGRHMQAGSWLLDNAAQIRVQAVRDAADGAARAIMGQLSGGWSAGFPALFHHGAARSLQASTPGASRRLSSR